MTHPRWSGLVPALVLSLALPALALAGPVLEVSGPGGTRTFTLAQLKKLPPTSGFAGTLNSAGKIVRPTRYRGVALADLMTAAGGFDAAHDLVVTAKDGYSMTYTHGQVTAGDFPAFDPGTGGRLEAHEPLIAILAWEHGGKPLDAGDDGPLRVVVVSARGGLLTDAHLSIKNVTKVVLAPAHRAWSLQLEGARTETIDQATFESGAAPGCHGVIWKDGQGRSWTGIPLWLMVGRVDDGRKHGAGAFADDLAAGYSVELIGADGARVSFPGARLSRNDGILVAHLLDGAPLSGAAFPLALAGADLRDGERLGGIVRLVLHPQDAGQAPGGGPAR